MLIKDGLVLHRGAEGYQFLAQDIRIQEGLIHTMAAALSPLEGEGVLSAKNALVMPGLVNSHVHSYTNLLKGTTSGEALELWSLGTVTLGAALSPEDMALSAQLGMVEMLRSGVTACIDHIPHSQGVDAIAQAYASAGFRVALAPMLHNRSDHLMLAGLKAHLPKKMVEQLEQSVGLSDAERIQQYEGWISKHHQSCPTTTLLAGPNSPQRCTRSLLEAVGDLVARHQLGVHAHLLETKWQRDTAQAEGDPVGWMEEAGLLTEKTSLAHCVWLQREQAQLLAERGCTVVHNPTSNLFLGSGVAPILEYRDMGIPIAFGSDGSNCATSHNMLEIARTALLLHRPGVANAQGWLQVQDVLDGLTLHGGRLLGSGQQLGRLAVGATADLAVWELDDPGLYPAIDLVRQLVFNLARPQIRHVVIQGRVQMEAGQIQSINVPELTRQLSRLSPRLSASFRMAQEQADILRPYYREAYGSRTSRI